MKLDILLTLSWKYMSLILEIYQSFEASATQHVFEGYKIGPYQRKVYLNFN